MTGHASTDVSKRVTLIVTTIAQFSLPFMLGTINIALPSIGKELAMEAVSLGWVNTSYLLVSGAFLISFGRLADIFGRKKIFILGLSIAIIAAIFCAISSSAVWLISFRVLQGVGGAMMVSTSIAILTSVFPTEERGRALGISMAGVYAGLSLGPFIGGVLTEHFGWQSIFLLSALMGLVLSVLVFWKLKGEWAEARGEKFDVFGSIILSVAIAVGMYGFSVLPTALGIVLVVVGVLGILVFVWWEDRTDSPILNLSLFRQNAVFVFSSLATLIAYSATFAVTFLLSLYLQYIKGLSPQTAGLILVAHPVVMVIFAPIAGRLSDRIEPRKVASIGLAFSSVALLLFAFLSEETTLGFIIASLALMGFGMGLFSTPNTSAIMGSVAKNLLGVASGTVATMRSCGMMLSMGIVMILFSIYIGEAQITPEYHPAFLISMRIGFIIFVALCCGGIFSQLVGRTVKQE